MRVILLAVVLLAASASWARSVNPVNISENNVALIKEIGQHCENRSFVESQECFKKLHDRYLLEGKFRGTIQYAEKNYKKFSDQALYKLSDDLNQLRKKSRELSDAMMDRVEGELTRDKYDAEIEWIAGELKARGLRSPKTVE